jgi:hypothetical protein
VGSLQLIADSNLVVAGAKNWVAGENATNYKNLPFPLVIDEDIICAAIKVSFHILYCHCFQTNQYCVIRLSPTN